MGKAVAHLPQITGGPKSVQAFWLQVGDKGGSEEVEVWGHCRFIEKGPIRAPFQVFGRKKSLEPFQKIFKSRKRDGATDLETLKDVATHLQ